MLDNQYHVTYSVEPMLEMLWMEGKSEITRYKVHYPIITPPQLRPPHITSGELFKTDMKIYNCSKFSNSQLRLLSFPLSDTHSDSEVFRITLGSFLPDVELFNLTLTTGVMSVEEANNRGFNVQQHLFPNGSKAFSMEVPFSHPAVLRTVRL